MVNILLCPYQAPFHACLLFFDTSLYDGQLMLPQRGNQMEGQQNVINQINCIFFFSARLYTAGFLWAETRAELTYMYHTELTQIWNSSLKILNKS